MDKEKFSGIFTALLTPFDKNNKINEKELERLVKFNLKKGVTGFYVGGSTAEAFFLSLDERKQIMEIVKDAAPESTLIAHIGAQDERVARELGVYANKLSYDLISSVTPFYYKFIVDEIRNYYLRLCDASGMKMLMYYFPNFSGVSMGGDVIESFLGDDRFAGMKFTANDFFTLERCKTKYPDKIVYNGFDEMLLSGLCMGADGGIGSTYNFMADKFVEIVNSFNAGDIKRAQSVQREANRIIEVLCKVGVMQAEKEVLNQRGFDFGVCREPFASPTDEQKALIAKEIIPFI